MLTLTGNIGRWLSAITYWHAGFYGTVKISLFKIFCQLFTRATCGIVMGGGCTATYVFNTTLHLGYCWDSRGDGLRQVYLRRHALMNLPLS